MCLFSLCVRKKLKKPYTAADFTTHPLRLILFFLINFVSRHKFPTIIFNDISNLFSILLYTFKSVGWFIEEKL